MFFFDYLNNLLRNILNILVKEKDFGKEILSDFNFNIEIPSLSSHGDVSSNIAMVYSKKTDLTLMELAEKIKEKLLNDDQIEIVKVVKPGFINIFFKDIFWQEQLKKILNNNNSQKKPDFKKK